VRLLLDTHAFLWFVAGDASLSALARTAIESATNEVFVSVASAWEVAIKVSLGKLAVDAPSVGAFFEEQMDANGFAYLPIDPQHVFRAAALPFHHRERGHHRRWEKGFFWSRISMEWGCGPSPFVSGRFAE
jgi:PIN domain nuclease of toxin-antitoxin system